MASLPLQFNHPLQSGAPQLCLFTSSNRSLARKNAYADELGLDYKLTNEVILNKKVVSNFNKLKNNY